MAWNQPGGNGGDRDPWGGRGGQQGPPDLDEALRKLQRRLAGIFGGGRGGSGGSGGGGGGGIGLPGLGGKGLIAVIVVLLFGWLLAGIYIVEPAEEGVVLRFGKYLATTGPGPHWAPYLIDRVEQINVEQIRRVEIGFRSETGGQAIASESLMLTRDENIVDLQFAVLYRVKDAKDYLFQVRDPDTTLRDVTESAIREVVGKSDMDFVITEGRSEVAAKVQDLSQGILDRYRTGLQVSSVNMQSAQPPREVQDAFSDAVKAREDEERFKNEARAYAADILPKARGDANAIIERAEAYKQRVVNAAEGDTARFLEILTEYEKAPGVTRQRLYLDAIEAVMDRTSKVLVDIEGGNSLIYLPVDRLLGTGDEDQSESNSQRIFQDSGSTRPGFLNPDRRRRDDRGRGR